MFYLSDLLIVKNKMAAKTSNPQMVLVKTVRYSQPTFDHLNTRHIQYLDPHRTSANRGPNSTFLDDANSTRSNSMVRTRVTQAPAKAQVDSQVTTVTI